MELMQGRASRFRPSRFTGFAAVLLALVTLAGCSQPALEEPGNQSPIATASAVPTSGAAPLVVTFTGSGSDPDGTITMYSWAFGDGGLIDDQSPTHPYQLAGDCIAVLTVTDDKGAIGATQVSIQVGVAGGNQPPTAMAAANPTSGNAPLAVGFTGSGTDPDGSVSTRVTYADTTKALIDARGNQPNGPKLGCTACHMAGGQSPPLTTYTEVYSTRAKTKSKIAVGACMREYLLAGEPEIITAWIDNGARQNNP